MNEEKVIQKSILNKKVRGRPSEIDKKELKSMIPNMTNAEAKDLVEYYKNKFMNVN